MILVTDVSLIAARSRRTCEYKLETGQEEERRLGRPGERASGG